MKNRLLIASNEACLYPILSDLADKARHGKTIKDKTGVEVVELINPKIILDPAQPYLDFGVRKTPEKYVKAELDWYDSQDLRVKEIGKTAKIWNDIASDCGLINSNYGWCIYSDENYNQYDASLECLTQYKESRRACMLYTRPSMQVDYCKDGMSDFICTNSTQQLIRNNKLIYVVNMRSNDAIFGLFNDFAWHAEVYKRYYNDLLKTYPDLEWGHIDWQANSFHVYDRHFKLLHSIVESNQI